VRLLSEQAGGAASSAAARTPEQDEVQALVDAVVDPASTHPMGLYAFTATDPGAALARAVERSAFEDLDDTERAAAVAAVDAYDDLSVFFCVIDQHRRLPAAALRMVVPSLREGKSITDIASTWGLPGPDLLASIGIVNDPARTWDAATLAVADDYRVLSTRCLLMSALVQALSVTSARCDLPWSVGIFDVPSLRLLQWKLHQPFSELPGLEPLATAVSPASLPAWGCVHDWHRRLAGKDPALFAVMAEGAPLEHVRPVEWEDLVAVVEHVRALADLPRLGRAGPAPLGEPPLRTPSP
jgi:hypothetical protein